MGVPTNPEPKPEFLPVADALNARGTGVWLGWRDGRGWVFLDRTMPFNKAPNEEYYFIQVNDWSHYLEDRSVWKVGRCYAFYAKRLGRTDPASRTEMRSAVEALCREYSQRASDLRAGIEQSIVEKEEAARRDAARRRDEERRQEREAKLNSLKVAMSDRQNADAEGIRQLVRDRNIRTLFHFTRIQNLPGILALGIVPRAELPADFPHNDEQRLEGFVEASSLSVSFPNYRMFYAYRCQNPNLNWAILAVSTETLVEQPCLFYPTNAAKFRFRYEANTALEQRMGLAGLASMFFDDPRGVREVRNLPFEWTTDPQAEVLVFDTVRPERFEAIALFRSDEEVEKLVHTRLPNISLTLGGPLFSYRDDYEFWQTSGA